MEAKDTVISPKERVRFVNDNTDPRGGSSFHNDLPEWVVSLLERQAEISFRAGKQETRKEIVEKITTMFYATCGADLLPLARTIDKKLQQLLAQLEEK